MKSPSQNVSKSLRGQSISGRGEFKPQRSELGGKPSMTAPGDGMVEKAPGAAGMERSAVAAADAMGNRGGMK
jgi:hypothetical protein